jgi:hypothetical protein
MQSFFLTAIPLCTCIVATTPHSFYDNIITKVTTATTITVIEDERMMPNGHVPLVMVMQLIMIINPNFYEFLMAYTVR